MIGIHKVDSGSEPRTGLNIGENYWYLHLPLPFSCWDWDWRCFGRKAWKHLYLYIGRYRHQRAVTIGERAEQLVVQTVRGEMIIGLAWVTTHHRTEEQETLWGLLDLEQPAEWWAPHG